MSYSAAWYFVAAGLLLWRTAASGEVLTLMALELRNKQPRYNFLGGKRDTEEETPHIVAAREAHEETGGELSDAARLRMEEQRETMRPVLWHAGGKYVLFVHELLQPDADLVERVGARGGTPRAARSPVRPSRTGRGR